MTEHAPQGDSTATLGASGLVGMSNPGCTGQWVPVATADRIAEERDRLREALVESRAYVAQVGQHDPAGIDLLDVLDEALG